MRKILKIAITVSLAMSSSYATPIGLAKILAEGAVAGMVGGAVHAKVSDATSNHSSGGGQYNNIDVTQDLITDGITIGDGGSFIGNRISLGGQVDGLTLRQSAQITNVSVGNGALFNGNSFDAK